MRLRCGRGYGLGDHCLANLAIKAEQLYIRPNKKNRCVSGYMLLKIRVGR